MCEPTYEIELELQDTDGSYMRERTDAEIAESFVLKAVRLVGEETEEGVTTLSSDSPTTTKRRRRSS